MHSNPPDLIQFDSVFVSPILSASTIESAYLKLRIYTQCKYVNESCLAELKLPLAPLMSMESRDNLAIDNPAVNKQMQQQSNFIVNNLLANLVTAATGSPLGELLESEADACEPLLSLASGRSAFGGPPSLSSSDARLQTTLDEEIEPDDERHQQEQLARQIEQNYCRSMMVSHWLNYLAPPAYECRMIREARGSVLLGISYLPTSNRIIFNANRASIDFDCIQDSGLKQLIKNLQLRSNLSYLLRILMVSNGRTAKRRDSKVSRQLEWDSEESITFDLVNMPSARPKFIVCLVARSCSHGSRASAGRLCDCHLASSACTGQPKASGSAREGPQASSRARRDYVLGHFVLADQVWRELRSQPRKQIVKKFEMY